MRQQADGPEMMIDKRNDSRFHESAQVNQHSALTFNLMNELKQRLAALGLSEQMIEPVLKTVADFVKSKLPENLQPAVDEIMAGKTPDLGGLLGSLGGLGGLFGKD